MTTQVVNSSGETIFIDVEQVARTCHQALKTYSESIAEYHLSNWGDASERYRELMCIAVEIHLAGDFDAEVTHSSWVEEQLNQGWSYGPVRDVKKKQHPCIVPFNQLPREQQLKGQIFRNIVHAFKN